MFPYSDVNLFQKIEANRFDIYYDFSPVKNINLIFFKFEMRQQYFVLDWIHPYCISQKLLPTLIKSLFFCIQLTLIYFLDGRIILNIHNKHNHKNRHVLVERLVSVFCIIIAYKIRIFSNSSINLIPKPFRHKVVVREHPLYPRLITSSSCKNIKQCLFVGADRPDKNSNEVRYYISNFMRDRLFSGLKLVLTSKVRQANLEKHESQLSEPSHSVFEELLAKSSCVILNYQSITTSGLLYHAVSVGTLVLVRECPFMLEILGADYPFFYHDESTFVTGLWQLTSLSSDEYSKLVHHYYRPIIQGDLKLRYYNFET